VIALLWAPQGGSVLTLLAHAALLPYQGFDVDLPWCLLTSLGVTALVFLAIGGLVGFAIGLGAAANVQQQDGR
jgi:hypothetical protein